MSNSGRKMSTPGWCTFALLGGVLVVAFGAFASATPRDVENATPQDKSQATTLVPAAEKTAMTKSANSQQSSSITASTGVQAGSSATPDSASAAFSATAVSTVKDPSGSRTASGGGVNWNEDFESYPDGNCMHGDGGWEGWLGDPTWDACLQEGQSHSANSAVDISGNADLVRVYSGFNSGVWNYCTWQYIPTNFSGLSYFILLNSYPATNWSTQISFDSSTGLMNSDFEGATLPFITGQWIELCVEIDLVLDVQTITYDGVVLSIKSWTDGVSGGGALNIGAVDLFGNGASAVYYDDMSLIEKLPTVCGDDICEGDEDTCNCPDDCGGETCGNGICCGAQGEDCANCEVDCNTCPECGDNVVDPGEDCDPPGSACPNGQTCQADCSCPGLENDDCIDRLPISDGDTFYDTTGANTDGLPHAGCQFDGQTYHDLWYNYTATCSGELTVSTCNQNNYDTDLVVYDGCFPDIPCPPTDANLLGCNDDGADCDAFSSEVLVPVLEGNCYKIRVGGWNDGDQGSATLSITCVTGPVCGDNICNGNENTCNCPADCPGPCDDPNACPGDSLYAQPPYGLDDPWTFGVSDVAFPAVRYESYSGADGPICDVHWWGGELDNVNGFVNCQPNGGDFEIKFYADAGGTPDTANPVCSYLLSVDRFETGDVYVAGGGTIPIDNIAYSVDLPECCVLESGWVSVQSQSLVTCGLWWLSSGVGDGSSLIDTGGGPVVAGFDLSLCLTPAECNDDGNCDEGENSCNCASDCGDCPGTCVQGACCGDGVVEGHEECDYGSCEPCPWDANDDGAVGPFDLAQLLGNWGPLDAGTPANILCLDIDGDLDLGPFDLANLLGNWGDCPLGFGEDQCVEGDCQDNCECVGRGACCGVKGDPTACDEDKTADECAAAGGNYQGDDTTCADCPNPVCINAEGDCCENNGTPGCDDQDCCALICALDPACCDEGWDSLCALNAAALCEGGCPIPGDNCEDRLPIFDGLTSFDTTGATTDGLAVPAGQCNDFGETQVNNDIWYNYIATCNGVLKVTTCEQEGGSAQYDSDLAMYTADTADCAAIPCPPGNDLLIACNDDDAQNPCGTGGLFHSTMRNVPVTAGICYKIRVGGWSAVDEGPGELFIECVQGADCGDGVCEGAEDCCSCPADCGVCDCGDGTCDAPCEDNANCPVDCTGCGNCDAGGLCDLQVGIQNQPDQACGDGVWVSLGYPFPGAGMVDTITMVNNTNTGGGDVYLMASAPDCGGPDVNNILATVCDGITGQPTGVPYDVTFPAVDTSGFDKVWVVAVFRSSFSFDVAFSSATVGTPESGYGNLSGLPGPGEWQDLNNFGFGACNCVEISGP